MDVCGRRRHRRTAVSLPEDVILEILVRVEDQAALFRCAVTCRPWNRLLADASFIRRRWPDQASSTFLAGYIAQKILTNAKRYSPLETSFVPTPRSVFGTGRRPLGSFLPEAAACLLSRAVPLVSRRGLLLMRLISDRARPASVLWLAVCNMLTGICELLPPLDCNWRCNHTGYAILTGADYSSNGEQQPSAPSGNPFFFKVLIIDNHNIYQPLNVHTFSSQEARWSTPTKYPFDAMAEGGLLALRRPEPVVCNGTAHWLVLYQCGERFYTCTLDVDMKIRRISLTRVEIPEEHLYTQDYHGSPILSVTNHRTLSIIFQRQGQGIRVVIWTRENCTKSEGGVAKWVHTRVLEVKPPGMTPDEAKVATLVCLDEKDGKMLIHDTRNNVVYIANHESGAMVELTGVSGDSWGTYHTGVLLEMDWPAFFASRLGSP